MNAQLSMEEPEPGGMMTIPVKTFIVAATRSLQPVGISRTWNASR
jgi:hypothetical protein